MFSKTILFHAIVIYSLSLQWSMAVPIVPIHTKGKRRPHHAEGVKLKEQYGTTDIDGTINTNNDKKKRKHNIPRYMLDLYNIISEQTDSDLLHHGDTVRTYFDSESVSRERQFNFHNFKIDDYNGQDEIVKKAELRIFKFHDARKHSRNSQVQINVVNRYNGHVVSSTIAGAKFHGWITFPITDIVRKWTMNPHSNHGIVITAKKLYVDRNNIEFASKDEVMREPMLVVFTKRKDERLEYFFKDLDSQGDTQQMMQQLQKHHQQHKQQQQQQQQQHDKQRTRRKKRSITVQAVTTATKRPKAICKLAPLKVPVNSIRWQDNVVSPEFLQINQCVGTCSAIKSTGKLHSVGTNHATVQALYALKNKNISLPCCAPSSFESQTVFLSTDSYLKIFVVKDLIVKSCACL